MSDETPDPIAAMNQLIAALADMARGVHSYYMALLEQGFTAEEAMVLTIAWQQAIITMAK